MRLLRCKPELNCGSGSIRIDLFVEGSFYDGERSEPTHSVTKAERCKLRHSVLFRFALAMDQKVIISIEPKFNELFLIC
jgi:hypothetical protein